jgi:hypothetical protein
MMEVELELELELEGASFTIATVDTASAITEEMILRFGREGVLILRGALDSEWLKPLVSAATVATLIRILRIGRYTLSEDLFSEPLFSEPFFSETEEILSGNEET